MLKMGGGENLKPGLTGNTIGGWLGLRNVLRQPPLQTLREA